MTRKNIVWFLSLTASGTNLRGKYQHFGLNLFFKILIYHNSVYKYEKKIGEILILRGQNWLGKQKVLFLLQSSFNVIRNTVWKQKNFWGLKMHCQNIVDGRCFQKEFFKRFLLNNVVRLSLDRMGPLGKPPASLALLLSRTSSRTRSYPALFELQRQVKQYTTFIVLEAVVNRKLAVET